MIITTKSNDSLLKKAGITANSFVVSQLISMIKGLALDPELANPRRDLCIFSTDDFKSTKDANLFMDAIANRHPKSRIIVVDRTRGKKCRIDLGSPDIDMVVEFDSKALADAISQVMNNDTISQAAAMHERKRAIKSQVAAQNDDVLQESISDEELDAMLEDEGDIPDFTPEVEDDLSDLYEEEPVQEAEVVLSEEPVVEPVSAPEPVYVPEDTDGSIVEKLNQSRKATDIKAYMHELSASTLIKDMIESNATYAGIESKFETMNNQILTILSNPSYRTVTEKLNAVRSLLHDRAYIASKGDSLLWQRVETIIDTICTKCTDAVDDELATIQSAIDTAYKNRTFDEAGNARLAGLGEESVNITLELLRLQVDINDIFKQTDGFITEVQEVVSQRSVEYVNDERLNIALKAEGSMIITDETLSTLRMLADTADEKVPTVMKELLCKVVSMNQLMNKLFNTERERIAAQQAALNYMKENNIENSPQYVNNLLRKSVRVFIAEEGTGRTIVPYLLSRLKSRQNANTLLIDLTGENKYDMYGVLPISLEQYITELNEKPFCLIAGETPNTASQAQRISTALHKSADYYRVINIVIRPDQKELFDGLAQDLLSVNYICVPNPRNLATMKGIIENTTIEGVAQRVIINKCDVSISPIVDALGIRNATDVQVCVVPTIDEIVDASLRRLDPAGISSVACEMEQVLRYC